MDHENFKNLIATTASICTILQFLTGILLCRKFMVNKTTGETSAFPFISGCLSTSLWLRYGIFIRENSVIAVNVVGSTLFFLYILVFLYYSIKKFIVVVQFLACCLFLIISLAYVQHQDDFESSKKTLGIICCLVTVLFFAAPLATLLHVIKVRNTDSLPFPIIFSNFITSAQWLIYGSLLDDKFIQTPNFLGCLLSSFQLCLFCIYPATSKQSYSNEYI